MYNRRRNRAMATKRNTKIEGISDKRICGIPLLDQKAEKIDSFVTYGFFIFIVIVIIMGGFK